MTNTVTQTQVQPTVILQTVTVQGGLTSRCLIATAAFGSELDPSVQTLRQFRDGFVLQTFAGRTFMDVFNAFYYSWSPAVAEAEYGNPALREAVKYMIYPLIGSLQVSRMAAMPLASLNSELSVITAGIIASTLLGLIYLTPMALIVRRSGIIRGRMPVNGYHIGLLMVLIVPILMVAVYVHNVIAVAVASSALVLAGLGFGCTMPFTAFRMLTGKRGRAQ
ncbi:MAG: CFI-box-CTERM domain-containing protein [Candidatus Caldarchaeum sp.]